MKALLQQARDYFDRLSKLGNEPLDGNSLGNSLAQEARAKMDAALSAVEQSREEFDETTERLVFELARAAHNDGWYFRPESESGRKQKEKLLAHLRAAPDTPVDQSREDWAKKALHFVGLFAQAVKDVDHGFPSRLTETLDNLEAHLRTVPDTPGMVLSAADIETLWRAHAPADIVDWGVQYADGGATSWLVEMSRAMIAASKTGVKS